MLASVSAARACAEVLRAGEPGVTGAVSAMANVLDTRFKKHQRERAIDEGKQFEKQPGIESVKVVREIYDQSDSFTAVRLTERCWL